MRAPPPNTAFCLFNKDMKPGRILPLTSYFTDVNKVHLNMGLKYSLWESTNTAFCLFNRTILCCR